MNITYLNSLNLNKTKYIETYSILIELIFLIISKGGKINCTKFPLPTNYSENKFQMFISNKVTIFFTNMIYILRA